MPLSASHSKRRRERNTDRSITLHDRLPVSALRFLARADSATPGMQQCTNLACTSSFGSVGNLVQFLAVFAEHSLHAKEEQFLFPLLATKSLTAGGKRDVNLLTQEHRSATQIVQELAKVSAAYIQNPLIMRHRVVELLRRLVELYLAHICE